MERLNQIPEGADAELIAKHQDEIVSVTKDLMKAFLLDEKACQMHQRILKLAEQYEVYVQTNNPEGTSTTTADSEEEDAEKQNTIYTKDSVVFGKMPISTRRKDGKRETNPPYLHLFCYFRLLFFAATILTWDHQCEEGPVVVSPPPSPPSHPTTKGRPHEDSLDFSHLSLCELQTDSATNEQLYKEKEKCSQVWIIFIFIDLGKKSVFSDHL